MPADAACQKCGARFSGANDSRLCPDCLADLQAAPTQKEVAPPLGDLYELPSSFGDYEVLGEIARGGMGVVYKARQTSLHRLVALKTIRPDRWAHENDVKRFRTETLAAAQLQHPNIVAIYDVGEVEGQIYYSMEYIEGRSLAQLALEKPLSAREAAACVQVVAQAIQYAHERGVLHRDLKPSNILMDAAGRPRLADFGLAKLAGSDSEMTVSGTVVGSPSYMPPEQAAGRSGKVDARSDVYALGAVLYDLLCGRPPFRAESALETLNQVLEMEPVAPRVLNPKVPRDLETICLKCLEKEPARRYPSARTLAEELGRFLRGEPIAARPTGQVERAWRWSRRKPASATALALLAVITVGSPVAAVFINRARRAAEQNRAIAEANLYVAEMNLALQDIEADHRARAIALLNKHLPRPGRPDFRSFEWRYLWREARGDYAWRLGFHSDAVRQVLFSPAGTLVASRSMDGTVQVWNARTREITATASNVVSLGGFSPDGQTLALGTDDHSVDVFDVRTGARRTLLTNAGILVKWWPEKGTAATTSTNWVLKLWDGRPQSAGVTVPGLGGGDPGRGERWALNVVVSEDASLAVFVDASDPQHERRRLRVWDLKSNRELARSPPMAGTIVALALSPDGRRVACGVEGRLHLWQWQRDGPPATIDAHSTAVRMIAFSPDGTMVATGASDQFIRIWDSGTGRLLQVRKGHENSVRALAFSPDGAWLASGGLNEPVRLWELSRGQEVDTWEDAAPRAVKDFARDLWFSSDSQTLALVTTTNSALVLDAWSLQPMAIRPDTSRLLGYAGVKMLAFSADSAGWWHPGQSERSIDFAPAKAMALSGDGRLIAVAAKGRLRIQNVLSGHEVSSITGLEGEPSFLVFSPDGRLLAGCDDKYRVQLWRMPQGEPLAAFTNHTDDVNHLAFSPDGGLLASSSSDKKLILWNMATLQERATLTGHRHAVYAVAFSPDGKLVATGSLDNTVKLWNLELLQEVGRFKAARTDEILGAKGVVMVAFAPDGNALAARLRDGGLRLWRAASEEQVQVEPLNVSAVR